MQTINSSRQPVLDQISQHWCSGGIFLSQVREYWVGVYVLHLPEAPVTGYMVCCCYIYALQTGWEYWVRVYVLLLRRHPSQGIWYAVVIHLTNWVGILGLRIEGIWYAVAISVRNDLESLYFISFLCSHQSAKKGSLCPSSVLLPNFAFAGATSVPQNTGWGKESWKFKNKFKLSEVNLVRYGLIHWCSESIAWKYC